jgi:hypothetical protein
MKWEYLVEGLPAYQGPGIGIVKTNVPQNNVMSYLNLRGSEGWELVQFAGATGAVGCNIYEPGIIFVFKRPRP